MPQFWSHEDHNKGKQKDINACGGWDEVGVIVSGKNRAEIACLSRRVGLKARGGSESCSWPSDTCPGVRLRPLMSSAEATPSGLLFFSYSPLSLHNVPKNAKFRLYPVWEWLSRLDCLSAFLSNTQIQMTRWKDVEWWIEGLRLQEGEEPCTLALSSWDDKPHRLFSFRRPWACKSKYISTSTLVWLWCLLNVEIVRMILQEENDNRLEKN